MWCKKGYMLAMFVFMLSGIIVLLWTNIPRYQMGGVNEKKINEIIESDICIYELVDLIEDNIDDIFLLEKYVRKLAVETTNRGKCIKNLNYREKANYDMYCGDKGREIGKVLASTVLLLRTRMKFDEEKREKQWESVENSCAYIDEYILLSDWNKVLNESDSFYKEE